MRKSVWIGLWTLSACVAVVAGVALGRLKGSEGHQPGPVPTRSEEFFQSFPARDLFAELDAIQRAVAEKDVEIRDLQDELVALKSQLLPPLSLEDEKDWKETLGWRRKHEAGADETTKRDVLRRKILQRKDKLLREQGLADLAALIQSSNLDDLETGLWVINAVGGVKFDKEGFKPHVLVALSHENPSVRRAALECAGWLCSDEEQLDMTLRAASDPSPSVREWAALRLGWYSGSERKEEAASALRKLLQEENRGVRSSAVEHLYGFADQMDDLLVKLMGDPGSESSLSTALRERRTISPAIARRLAEMYGQDASEDTIMRFLEGIPLPKPDEPATRQGDRSLPPEARPILAGLYVQIVRESLQNGRRRHALDALRRIGDRSLIFVLDEIARSPDAEGIEKDLQDTIEYLRQKGIERR